MAQYSDAFGKELSNAIAGRPKNVIARMTGFSHTAIGNWKEGQIPSSANDVRKLADALGIPRSRLMKATGGFHEPSLSDIEHDRKHFPEHNREAVTPPTLEQSLKRLGNLVEPPERRILSTVGMGSLGDREETDGLPMEDLIEFDYIF